MDLLASRGAAARPCEVQVVDIRPIAAIGDEYAEVVDGIKLRSDGVHLTDAGADRIARYVIPRAQLGLALGC